MDVVVPVYNAVDDLERCVESVLTHTDFRYRLVLIDDASPDPAVATYFAALARRALPHVVLLRNRRNRGFPRTANRGMLLSRADVVLLNSDTVVTRGWFERARPLRGVVPDDRDRDAVLQQCGDLFVSAILREQRAGRRRRSGRFAARLRAPLCRRTRATDGRGLLLLYPARVDRCDRRVRSGFRPGYGEENDFCMRALAAGYRSVLCDDAYVLHLGGRSFEGQKPELGARNLALLLDRHPRLREDRRGVHRRRSAAALA